MRTALALALILASAPAFAGVSNVGRGRGDTYAPNAGGGPSEPLRQPFTGWSHDGKLSDGDSFGPDPTAHENRR